MTMSIERRADYFDKDKSTIPGTFPQLPLLMDSHLSANPLD